MEGLQRSAPKVAWEMAAQPTVLSAPDGSVIARRQSVAPGDSKGSQGMGTMWARVQCVATPPACRAASQREQTPPCRQKNHTPPCPAAPPPPSSLRCRPREGRCTTRVGARFSPCPAARLLSIPPPACSVPLALACRAPLVPSTRLPAPPAPPVCRPSPTPPAPLALQGADAHERGATVGGVQPD